VITVYDNTRDHSDLNTNKSILTGSASEIPYLKGTIVTAGDDFGRFAEKLGRHHLARMSSQRVLQIKTTNLNDWIISRSPVHVSAM
jgi:hypothetical protein